MSSRTPANRGRRSDGGGNRDGGRRGNGENKSRDSRGGGDSWGGRNLGRRSGGGDDGGRSFRDEDSRSAPRGSGLRPMPSLDNIEATKKKFTGRCRLFVGNLPMDAKESEIKELFSDYGEIAECFLSGKGFAFIRLETRAAAEGAKEALDGSSFKNRTLRVRFAVHGASLKVTELTPYVSNELLFQAFSQFGEVERAIHIVDEKGRPIGEGIVEFARKGGALEALKRINDGVFLLTGNPRPVHVEALEARDEEDGLAERMVQKNDQFRREREQQPRFAPQSSFEHEFGNRWKELYAMEKAKKEQLDKEMTEMRMRLESEMDLAFQDYQANLLREDLRRRQEELERLEAQRKERMDIMQRRGGGGGGGGGLDPFGLPTDRPFAGGPQFGDSPFQEQQFRGGPGVMMGGMGDNNGGGMHHGGGGMHQQQRPADDGYRNGVNKLLQMFKGNEGGVPPPQQQRQDMSFNDGFDMGRMDHGGFGTPQHDFAKRRRH